MKPNNWNQLPRKEKLKLGTELFCSQQGKYLVSMAIAYGLEALKNLPEHQDQTKNIQELEILHETLFDQFNPQKQ